MTAAPAHGASRTSGSLGWLVAVALAFVGVHAALGWIAVTNPGGGFADVGLYQWWADNARLTGVWPVLDEAWVYPAGALAAVMAPTVLPGHDSYMLGWVLLVTALDAGATVALARRHPLAAGWWIAFIALLGPVAMGRVDAIAAPLAILGLLAAARRPAVAAALLTIGAWVKVAPGALVIALVNVVRRPVRDVVVPAAAVCVVVVGAVAAGGGLANIATFLTTQDSRGLQLESVAATGWVLAWISGYGVEPVFNHELITWEIVGPGTAATAHLLGWLLPVTVGVIALLTWRARGRRTDAELLGWSSFGLMLALIVTNKVGSPQFIGWLAAPVAVGLATWAPTRPPRDGSPDLGPHERLDWITWPGVAMTTLLVAAMTQLVFPWGYLTLLGGSQQMAMLLAARNLVVLGLLAAALAKLAVLPARTSAAPVPWRWW